MSGAWGRVIAPGGLKASDTSEGQPLTAGGYGETRDDYTSALFAPADGSEPRTVHIGLDIFAAAGTPVFAPLDARIHSFADNAGDGDYGPTIILEHEPAPGLMFHTLYGHLSRASLEGLSVGQRLAAGDRIGRLGTRAENGGWTPHLHVQVMLEIGDARGDYPGACRASQRAHWLAICPDPAELLGLKLA
jgi:murein DD-endopeptidase MepM/ murein hydrolase activator NlpD